jgi:protocatechuate 3,4-dioxygenase beta subunit
MISKRLWLSLVLLLVIGVPFVYLFTSKKVLTGRVYDGQTGELISGADVVVEQMAAIADDQGYYRLEGVQEEFVVSAQAPGYLPFAETFTASGLLARGFVLDIALQPSRLSGTVYDELSGLPVDEAVVSAGESSAKTDALGHYEMQRIAGQPPLSVQADGYLPWQGSFSIDKNLLHNDPLDVTLVPNTVMAVVRDVKTGAIVEGAVLTVAGGEVSGQEDGSYVLRRVRPGESIAVQATGYQPTEQIFAGGESLVIDLRPREVMLLVSDAFSGRPIAEVEVTGSAPVAEKDEDGQVTLYRVALGETITVRAEGYESAQTIYNGEESLSLFLRPASLRGVVRDASTGQPIAGALIYVEDRVLVADENGVYLVSDLPEQPTLMIKAAGYRKERVAAWQPAEPVMVYCSDSSLPCADLMLTPFKAKGIYISLPLLSLPDRVRALIDLVDRTELNAIVVDVKGDRGWLAYTSRVPLAQELGVEVGDLMDLKEFLSLCEERGIYTIARLVIFKDSPLAFGRPELAIKRADGTVWTDSKGAGWTNPFRQEVVDYNIAIAVEVAQMGFDEIQVDYIRFPSDGDVTTIVYEEADNTMENRTAAINSFLVQLRAALQLWQVFTSADIFGLTVSVAPSSDMGIGQRVDDIAPLVDYICPMVYPSTYISGNFGLEEPAKHPYEVVYRAMGDALRRVKTKVRPWLQHYSWKVTFDLPVLQAERQAAEEAGAWGWAFWNAGGRYDYEELFTSSHQEEAAQSAEQPP